MSPAKADGPDLAEELLDVVEADGTYVATLPRSVVHAEGLWHQVFHCLIVRSRPPARVLLQRRKSSARAFPGKLDLSATGHLSAGESPLDGVREIEEEVGLIVAPERLVALERRLLVDDSGEGRNREVAHVYLLVDDTPLDALPLDPGEVDGFVEVEVADLLRLLTVAGASATVPQIDTSRVVSEVQLTMDDLVPDLDGYWVMLAEAAQHLTDQAG